MNEHKKTTNINHHLRTKVFSVKEKRRPNNREEEEKNRILNNKINNENKII